MTQEANPEIRNKYDPYTVKAKIDEVIEKHIEESYDYSENNGVDYTLIGLGLVTGSAALGSYFHKTAWPEDLPIIITCIIIYYIAVAIQSYIKNKKVGNFFIIVKIKNESKVNNSLFEAMGIKEDVWLKVASFVEMFDNKYDLQVSVWNSDDSKCLGECELKNGYESFVSNLGFVQKDKIKDLFLNAIKGVSKKGN